MYWRCDYCNYFDKNGLVCERSGLISSLISEDDCPIVSKILYFETSPDYEYSVIMPTETNLIFCGFFDTKEEAEAEAKKIHGFVLHDMRYAK